MSSSSANCNLCDINVFSDGRADRVHSLLHTQSSTARVINEANFNTAAVRRPINTRKTEEFYSWPEPRLSASDQLAPYRP